MDYSIRVTLNSDKNIVAAIKRGLSHTGGYCPCRIQKNEDTKCMCKEFREQIDDKIEGLCHCGLYKITVENNGGV